MTQSTYRRVRLRPLACCLLTFALLILTLDAQSIWWDEGISLHLASLPWREVLEDRAANIHPPLYFLILKAWTGLAGGGPFAGRFLSALAATLLPAAVYRFLRRRISPRAGRAAAFLVALAPPFINYGQETRAYALLPIGVIALWSLVWPPSLGRRNSLGPKGFPKALGPSASLEITTSTPPAASPTRRGLLLGLLLATLIGLHYTGIIAAGVAALGYALRWLSALRRGSARDIAREWLTGLAVMLLCLVPWAAIVVGMGFEGLGAQAGISNLLAEPAPAGYVAALLSIFHTTGMPEALSAPELVRVGWLVGGLMALGVTVVLFRRGFRSPQLRLLLLWLVPFCGAPVIWSLSSQSHPRYLFAFVAGGWLVAAFLVTHRDLMRMPRMLLLSALLASNLLGLRAYLFDPAYARSDVRAVAAYVRERATPGDLVLVPYTDWSLDQYDLGSAELVMAPASADADRVWVDGNLFTDAGLFSGDSDRTVFVLDYQRDALDPRDGMRAALAWGGVLEARQSFHGVFVERHAMTGDARVSGCEPLPPVCMSDEALCLVGAAFSPQPVSGGALPVVLCWSYGDAGRSASQGTSARYAVGLRLYGPAGDLVAMHNDLLLDAALRPTDQWSAQEVTSYHLVPVPVGAVPAPHTLQVGLFGAQTPDQPVTLADGTGVPVSAVALGEPSPAVAPWRDTSLYATRPLPDQPVAALSDGLRLSGARLDRTGVYPGQTIYTSLAWQVLGAGDTSPAPRLVLQQAGQALVTVPSSVSFAAMPAGRPLLETLALPVPAAATSGQAEVLLVAGPTVVSLGKVEVVGGEHTFEVPPFEVPVRATAGDVATLLGVNLAPGQEVIAGRPVTLTLIWRAESGAAGQDLKVFTHLVSETGDLLAQHDGQPAGWTRPTSGWLAGEIIRDTHVLVWSAPLTDPSGLAVFRVGLYDGVTGTRLLWQDGRDALDLPLSVTVVANAESTE